MSYIWVDSPVLAGHCYVCDPSRDIGWHFVEISPFCDVGHRDKPKWAASYWPEPNSYVSYCLGHYNSSEEARKDIGEALNVRD